MARAFHQRTLLFVPIAFSLVGLITCETVKGNTELNIPHTSPSHTSTRNDLSAPIVLVMANDINQRKAGYGAVIGDGSLVVTAYHIVFNCSDIGLHRMPLFPVVISPYLGDICYGRILGADSELDLAILQTSWVGHPGYTLASDKDLHQIDKVALLSRTEEDVSGERHLWGYLQTERLPIRDLSSRHGIVSQVFLKGYGRLSDGWSGCPMIAEEKHLLVGCFTIKHSVEPKIHLSIWPEKSGYSSKHQEFASGPAAGWMRKLVIEANAAEKLNKAEKVLNPPADSDIAMEHLRKTIECEASPDYAMKEEAVKESEPFLQLRPESVVGITRHAGRLADIGRINPAEKYYKRAKEYDSSQAYVLMAYGQFLEDGKRPNEALAQYRQAETLEPNNSHVAYAIARMITFNDTGENPLSRVEKLIQKYPENGYLLALRAQIYHKQRQIEQAIETTKAVIMLMPEDIGYRRVLSMILEQNHREDEAEIQLRDIVKLAPDDANAYFWLATFLSKKRPASRQEAIQLAERALYLHKVEKGPEKAKIEKILSDLKNRTD